MLSDVTFAFPVGSVHDLAGAYTATPTINPLVMIVAIGGAAYTYEGACGGNTWRAPWIGVFQPIEVGATEIRVADQASCFGTTIALVLHDDADAVVDEWVMPSTTRSPPASILTLPLEAGLRSGGYELTGLCGTFDAPVSGATSTSFGVGSGSTTTTGSTATVSTTTEPTTTEPPSGDPSTTQAPSAPPAQPVVVEPTLTG